MSESITHRDLVQQLYRWVSARYLNGGSANVLVDDGDPVTGARPPNIGGAVPDVFAKTDRGDGVIIGEAKTSRDLETPRSVRQIELFYRFCAQRQGSVLVLAVPWTHENAAGRLLRTVRRKLAFEFAQVHVMRQLSDP